MVEDGGDVPALSIETRILVVRGHNVLLDFDLAHLYGVETKALNQSVTRNTDRFPEDFMFRLTKEELEDWRSQFVTSNPSARMSMRRPPRVFTEQGVAMLSSVIRSRRAVQVNIQIMRTFVQLRRLLATHEDLARKLSEMEGKYDTQFKVVFDAIRKLMQPPLVSEKPPIGFHQSDQK